MARIKHKQRSFSNEPILAACARARGGGVHTVKWREQALRSNLRAGAASASSEKQTAARVWAQRSRLQRHETMARCEQ